MNPHRWFFLSALFNWLVSRLRFGSPTTKTWLPYHQVGSKDCPRAILFKGGLSANSTRAARMFARTLHRENREVHVWSRNLSGHTGAYADFARSRFWHWIHDAMVSTRKLVNEYGKTDIILIGHSTGSLVVMALVILAVLLPRRLFLQNEQVRIRAVLVFPPFRLRSRRDTILLWIVAALYYPISFAAFGLLAFSGPWMWPLSILGFACHVLFVPQIWIPNGEELARERANETHRGRRWAELPDGLLLALACLFYVSCPPILAFFARVYPGQWAQGVFALFITLLIVPLFWIPKEFNGQDGGKDKHEPSCYRWLPVVTAANLMLLQWIVKRFLFLFRCPVLVIEGELDNVVDVDDAWLKLMGSKCVEKVVLKGYQHSDLTDKQQEELAKLVLSWCKRTDPKDENGNASPSFRSST